MAQNSLTLPAEVKGPKDLSYPLPSDHHTSESSNTAQESNEKNQSPLVPGRASDDVTAPTLHKWESFPAFSSHFSQRQMPARGAALSTTEKDTKLQQESKDFLLNIQWG